ncbi:MAG: hypothetical protein Q7T76_19010 [Ferruginibacter sp.]|nr:hypothetical protein [Ferruginibacter sp.]
MKYMMSLVGLTLLFCACSHTDKQLKERIISADSIAVNFFSGDGSMDTVIGVKIIRDRQQVTDLATFISDHKVKPDFDCGYDGSLHFFKTDKVIQDIYFRMEDKCMYFTFMQYGKQEASKLSLEAKAVIQSIKTRDK